MLKINLTNHGNKNNRTKHSRGTPKLLTLGLNMFSLLSWAYSKTLCQLSKIEVFAKIVNG